jgi:putative transcriptional regulator
MHSGDLLIAPPNMPDARFRKSVILLTHDLPSGSFALCLNRETQHTVSDIVEDLGIGFEMAHPLYWGGPMSPSTIWMLHSDEWQSANTHDVCEGWSMTSTREMFDRICDGDEPQHYRFFSGYCSWGPGQLEGELTGHEPWGRDQSWLVARNPGAEWLLEQPIEHLWSSATTLSSHQAVASWL